MKICKTCKETKVEEDFSFRSTKKGIRHSSCKKCSTQTARHNYKNNPSYRHVAKVAALRHKQNKREKFHLLKSTLSCQICNEANSCCLDFHHIDKKKFNIGNSRDSVSWKILLEEIKKCIVLCANCHRKIHAGIIQLPV